MVTDGFARARRWPLIVTIVVVLLLVVGVIVVAARRDDGGSVASRRGTFTPRLPPVVLATDGSASTSSTSSTATDGASTSSGSSSTTSAGSTSSGSTPDTAPFTETTVAGVVTTVTTPVSSSTSTTTTTTTTQPPQCFVPAQISIVFSDGTTPKVSVSGDGISGRTFTFQWAANAPGADVTIDGLKECGQHYQMDLSAQGGKGSSCGLPPTLSGTFQDGIPNDPAAIFVAPHGASC